MKYNAENRDQEMDKLKEEIDHLVMFEELRTNQIDGATAHFKALTVELKADIAKLKVVKILAFSKHL